MLNVIDMGPVDTEILIKEVTKILGHWPPTGTPQQIMVQSVKGKNDLTYGTGRVHTFNHNEEDFNTLIHDTPYLNKLVNEVGMYRTRLMTIKKAVYSWHMDATPRIHIPIFSDPEFNFMVVQNEVIRMPVGRMYWVNTKAPHTYVNTREEPRLHIVGCVNSRPE